MNRSYSSSTTTRSVRRLRRRSAQSRSHCRRRRRASSEGRSYFGALGAHAACSQEKSGLTAAAGWLKIERAGGFMSEYALSIVLGVGLAAATGFRVFLPMLVASVAAYTGHLPLDNGFAWLATPSAITMLAVAAFAEILAYYIPGVDNMLDTLATPTAFVAGTVL